MLKRTVVIGTVLAVLMAMGPLAAYAQTPAGKPAETAKPATKPAETGKPAIKPAEAPKTGEHVRAHAANTLAVCGCGKVFVPDAKTTYIEYEGKRYACCSDECHKMAMADPAKAAKMADDNMAKVLAQLNPPKQ